MRFRKLPMPARLFIPVGLLMVTLPGLIGHYVTIPDFWHGALIGLGLALETGGIIKLKQSTKPDASC